jgi:hypothetical protein
VAVSYIVAVSFIGGGQYGVRINHIPDTDTLYNSNIKKRKLNKYTIHVYYLKFCAILLSFLHVSRTRMMLFDYWITRIPLLYIKETFENTQSGHQKPQIVKDK